MAQLNSKLKVTMYWGDILYDTAICKANVPITIGREANNTFVMDLQNESNLLQQTFTLVNLRNNGMADVFFEEHYDGHIKKGDKMFSLASAKSSGVVEVKESGVYSAQLTQEDKADFVIGYVSFYLEWVTPSEKLVQTPFFDKKKALVFFLSLLFISGFMVLLQKVEVPEEEKPPERLVTLESRKPRGTSPTPNNSDPSKAAIGNPKTADGGAQSGPSGKVETKIAETASAASSLRKANLGSLVSGLTKTGASAPSADSRSAGAVEAAIAQEGTGGFSTEGLKQGGGGKTTGIGRALGAGEGGFGGTGRLGLAGNSSVDGAGSGGGGGSVSKVAGGLDREVIESIIRKRLDRIRLCYERQLNFYPKLAGKITVHFVIGKTGNVIESGTIEDTMKNATVKSCILSEVKSWNFPTPEGGTLVNVDYPFVFESSARGK